MSAAARQVVLRGLTLWRPWSASIVHGPKRVENRPWHPPIALMHGDLWIALHAGRTWDGDSADFILKNWRAAMRLVGNDESQESAWPAEWRAQGVVGVARVEQALRVEDMAEARDPWAFGPWCWTLADVRAVPDPIACRGAQGLWTLPAEVEARLLPLCVRSAA